MLRLSNKRLTRGRLTYRRGLSPNAIINIEQAFASIKTLRPIVELSSLSRYNRPHECFP